MGLEQFSQNAIQAGVATSTQPKTKSPADLIKAFTGVMKQYPSADPIQIGIQMGLSAETVRSLVGSGAGKNNTPSIFASNSNTDYKNSSAMETTFKDQKAQDASVIARGRNANSRLKALDNIQKESGISQLGGGFIKAGARLADTVLEGLGVDIFQGSQKDMNTLNAGTVDDIAQVADLWKGSISDFENKLFDQTAAGPSKSPEFIRQNLAKSMMAGVATNIRAMMADQLSSVYKRTILPSAQEMSDSQVKDAIEHIRVKYGLPDPSAEEPGSQKAVDAVRKWAAWVDNRANQSIIRAVILTSTMRDNPQQAIEDPNNIQKLIRENLLQDGYDGIKSTDAIPKVNNLADLKSAPTEKPAIQDFKSPADAMAYLDTIPKDQWPSVSFSINGVVKRFKAKQ
jgi:hypothetical protein